MVYAASSGNRILVVLPVALVTELPELSSLQFFTIRVFFEGPKFRVCVKTGVGICVLFGCEYPSSFNRRISSHINASLYKQSVDMFSLFGPSLELLLMTQLM
jgi:hypothetical protein